MYSKNDPTEIKDFMKDLGFPSFEDSEAWEAIAKQFTGKIVTIKQGALQVTGKFHSLTMIFGSNINLTEVQEDKCNPEVLAELHYYHPRNYKPEFGFHNFGPLSSAFIKEDPKKFDLLIVPASGCILECEDQVLNLPLDEGDEEEGFSVEIFIISM
jgi:hypothetical protein